MIVEKQNKSGMLCFYFIAFSESAGLKRETRIERDETKISHLNHLNRHIFADNAYLTSLRCTSYNVLFLLVRKFQQSRQIYGCRKFLLRLR